MIDELLSTVAEGILTWVSEKLFPDRKTKIRRIIGFILFLIFIIFIIYVNLFD